MLRTLPVAAPAAPEPRTPALDAMVGGSPALRAVLARAARVAPTTLPVLVTGESGTGKELLARALHELGPCPSGPYVVVNCGALPRELAESELFGHERGAFTGAAARRAGWFEEASGGTLVLDEIGELPLDLQPKLLRVLETGRLRRVGGAGETAVRVRVVAMTLRDLAADARRGAFRLDLFHRLAGVELRLPSLRERAGDVPLLVQHFLREIEAEVGPRAMTADAVARLCSHSWPGNVRELRNAVRRAAVFAGPCIDAAALEIGEPARRTWPPASRAADVAAGEEGPAAAPPIDRAAVPAAGLDGVLSLAGRTFDEIERYVYAWALAQCAGSRRRAARLLAISRSTFCDKAKRFGLG